MDIVKTLERAEEAPDDPFRLFQDWLAEAAQSEPNDPNAMCLATIGPDQIPHARIVLLKDHDERGFVFYTNMDSQKGQDLKTHPIAALNFHWKTLGRAVRITGKTESVTEAESDAYFTTRPRGSRIGAWASQQSRPLASRSALEQEVAAYEDKFKDTDNIPRPPHWYGTRVVPEQIEFWHAGDFRLHTRLLYRRQGEKSWDKSLLYP